MSILATLAQQYFGAGQTATLRLGAMDGIGTHFDEQIANLCGDAGSWNPSPEAAIDLSRLASATETGNVAASEWTKQQQRLSRARLQTARIIGQHHKAMASISVETAKLQDSQVQGLYPLALKMGTTVSSHEGRVSAIAQARSRLFG